MSSTVRLGENARFTLALLLELEEDFPGCLDEMASALPATSALRKFIVETLSERPADAKVSCV